MADALLVEIDGGEPDLEWMFLSDVDLAGYTNPSRTSWDYPILSPETKERLEEIVKSCNSDVIKKMFYQNVNEAKEKPQKISPKIDIKDREKALEILSSGRIFHREIFRLKNFFYEAEEFGIGNTEEVKEYGERMYEYHIKKFPFDKCYLDGAQDPGSYELKIFIEVARKFLKKPEEEIIELENKRLRKAMRGEEIRNGGIEFEDYLKRVDDASRDLSTERVQAVAQKVYEDLTEDNTKIMHGANYLLAVHLAKTYDFGEDKFKEVADKALEVRKGGKLPDYYYFQQEVELFNVQKFNSITGKGVEAKFKNKHILLGNRKLMQEKKVDISEKENNIQQLEEHGKTVMIIAINNKITGLIAVADTLKEHSKEAVDALHKMDIQVMMITGDNRRTGEAIAKQVGIDKVLAEVLPKDKAENIKKLQEEGKIVAMVGDGINDAPALTQADIGIAIGSGTDVAIESGDIVLIKEDLTDVAAAMDLSNYTMKKIKQNLFWAFFYNTIGIPVAAGVLYPFTGWLLSPVIAGAAMAFSSVSVVLNSLVMKRYKVKKRI